MFATRAIAVSISVFVVVYCAMSLVVCLGWRQALRRKGRRPEADADLLFVVRMAPVFTALVITAAFAMPSFLLLEPREIDEPLGGVPLLLSVAGIGLAAAGVAKGALALFRTCRAVSAWKNGALPVKTLAAVPVLQVTTAAPAMTAAGIVHPTILVSAAAQELLSQEELRSALQHELVHLRRRDNLRKLLLRCVAFPGMSKLEARWTEATEMAADEAAVSSSREALDLAGALIKLSRVRTECASAELTAALVQSPASMMNARVERLLAWTKPDEIVAQKRSRWYGYGAALAALSLMALSYPQVLIEIHTATEWLMR
ncbi:MAG TPA: M56 family metallopeptidase [Candidatus Sulfotelmatobacter sp.]|nr:M56 family metallopeptidase [Candidatus Sulfotelmatobacter sp.]